MKGNAKDSLFITTQDIDLLMLQLHLLIYPTFNFNRITKFFCQRFCMRECILKVSHKFLLLPFFNTSPSSSTIYHVLVFTSSMCHWGTWASSFFCNLIQCGHTLNISPCTDVHKELCVFVYSFSIEFPCKNPSLQPFE